MYSDLGRTKTSHLLPVESEGCLQTVCTLSSAAGHVHWAGFLLLAVQLTEASMTSPFYLCAKALVRHQQKTVESCS
jgi:hypothetical protein